MVHTNPSWRERHNIINETNFDDEYRNDWYKQNIELPIRYSKKWAIDLREKKLIETDIDVLIEEIRRRNQFDEQFDINNNDDISNNDTEAGDQYQPPLCPTLRLLEFLWVNTKNTNGG